MILQIAIIRYKSPQNSLQIALFLGAENAVFFEKKVKSAGVLCELPQTLSVNCPQSWSGKRCRVHLTSELEAALA